MKEKLQKYWLYIVLGLLILSNIFLLYKVFTEPALSLTKANISSMAQDDVVIREQIVPLLQKNIDSGRLIIP